jgi:hypothetical protein
MLAMLENHLKLFNTQSESWRENYDEVMARHDNTIMFGEIIAYGLYILSRMDAWCLGDGVERKVTISKAKGACDLYEWWHKKGGELIDFIDSVDHDFPVEKVEDFRVSHESVGHTLCRLRKLKESIAEYEAGNTTTLEDLCSKEV